MQKKVKSFFFQIVVVSFSLIGCNNSVIQQVNEIKLKFPQTKTYDISKEYLQLLNNNKNITLINTVNIRGRNPISFFYYSRNYCLQIYKIDSNLYFPVRKVVNSEFHNTHNEIGAFYTILGIDSIASEYKLWSPGNPQKITFSLYGENSSLLFSSDSVMYYYSNFQSLSISNTEAKNVDIRCHVLKENQSIPLPIEIMFLKRNNSLYLLLLSSRHNTIKLDKQELFNLVYKR